MKLRKGLIVILATMLVFSLSSSMLPPVCGETTIRSIHETPATYFGFGNGAYLGFNSSATCDSISRSNEQWTFTNLLLNNDLTTFSFYATTNVTINAVNFSRWLNYTVHSEGEQTMLTQNQPDILHIDGIVHHIGNGWTYSEGYISVTQATNNVSIFFSKDPQSSPSPTPTPTPTVTPSSTPTSTTSPTPSPTIPWTDLPSPNFSQPISLENSGVFLLYLFIISGILVGLIFALQSKD